MASEVQPVTQQQDGFLLRPIGIIRSELTSRDDAPRIGAVFEHAVPAAFPLVKARNGGFCYE